jgi:UDP-N-acetylmuramoyl-L-alanyl-D-glutamate--2,6-diaminopimelate ligase
MRTHERLVRLYNNVMLLDEALASVPTVEVSRENHVLDLEVTGVHYDSRRIRRGDIFVAMRGEATDGNRFIADAMARGAAAVVTDSAEMAAANPDYVLVAKGRRALAGIAANLFGHPERKLKICAVTGTNGKTTSAFLLEQMLQSAGRKSVLLGTIENHIAGEVVPSEHTTPEARDLLAFFARGVQAGATEAVMEMSSHALDQERVWGLPVDVAIFTNLTQDHLDYHGSMERYFEAKARLFAGVGTPPPRIAVINADDGGGGQRLLGAGLASRVMSYGISCGLYRADRVKLGAGHTEFVWETPQGSVVLESPLTGRVNVYNLLAASCAALARGLTLDEIAQAAVKARQVPGRFEVVPSDLGFTVVVDYAHTEDALRNLMALGRELAEAHGGRVITLFGCGGDRDRGKRPRMGRAAAEGSDLVILTSDNPRGERPSGILDEAYAGIAEVGTTCIVEEDRAGAIEIAIRSARPGDIVLLAGKGHEKVQILQDRTLPFDDVAVAAGVIAELR